VSEPIGIDRPSVERWIDVHVDELTGPYRWRQLSGGHSNLTYLVEGGDGTRVVVRRPPLGQLQPRAHDMHREYRIVCSLAPTDVPVARPYAYCADADVTGAHFYVMAFVDGSAAPRGADLAALIPDPAAQRAVAESFLEALAALHLLDPGDIGLGDLSRPDGYLERQLTSWYRSWTTSAEAAGLDDPRSHELHDLLRSHQPEPGPTRVIHGDYGFHNCLVVPAGRVAAVVDWEVATLGDVRADLAYVLNRWSVEGAELPGREELTMPPSFPSLAEAITIYQAMTGADLADLDYFITFNHWRSACIAHGVYTRYVRGQKPTEGVDVEGFRRSVDARLSAAMTSAASI